MIDIKFLRENPDVVKQNIKNKFQDKKLHLVDEVIELDKKYREVKQNGDELRSQRKTLSEQVGQLMREGKKEEAGHSGGFWDLTEGKSGHLCVDHDTGNGYRLSGCTGQHG